MKKSEDVGESKKGQRLIEKEAMETGQVIEGLGLPIYFFSTAQMRNLGNITFF